MQKKEGLHAFRCSDDRLTITILENTKQIMTQYLLTTPHPFQIISAPTGDGRTYALLALLSWLEGPHPPVKQKRFKALVEEGKSLQQPLVVDPLAEALYAHDKDKLSHNKHKLWQDEWLDVERSSSRISLSIAIGKRQIPAQQSQKHKQRLAL